MVMFRSRVVRALVLTALAIAMVLGLWAAPPVAAADPDPMIDVQWTGVSDPDLWGRTYDLWQISYVDGDGSVWYRVTSAQGMPGDPVVPNNDDEPGSAWTAQGFVTPTSSRTVKVLNHLEPNAPFLGGAYADGWDANPRQICVEYSNSLGPWSSPICAQVPILLARGECVDLTQIRLCFVGISDPSEPDAYRNTKKGWYCWRVEYIQGDDWTKSCWFEVQPPSFATSFPYTGFVKSGTTFGTRKVWTAADEITLLWTGRNKQVYFTPDPYGPVTAYAVP